MLLSDSESTVWSIVPDSVAERMSVEAVERSLITVPCVRSPKRKTYWPEGSTSVSRAP